MLTPAPVSNSMSMVGGELSSRMVLRRVFEMRCRGRKMRRWEQLLSVLMTCILSVHGGAAVFTSFSRISMLQVWIMEGRVSTMTRSRFPKTTWRVGGVQSLHSWDIAEQRQRPGEG